MHVVMVECIRLVFRGGGAIHDSGFSHSQGWRLTVVDVQGFDCSSPWVVGFHLLDLGCLPVYPVLLGPCVNYNTIFLIMSLHCSFVLTYSLPQHSPSFSNVDTFTLSTWYLVYNFFLLPLWSGWGSNPLSVLGLPWGFPSIWRSFWCPGSCTPILFSHWYLNIR